MRYLVTGASGFVGRGLLCRLADRSIPGVATGRTSPADLPSEWTACRREDVLSGAVDVGPVDVLVHLEVRQHVPRPTAADVEHFHRVNVVGTHDWLAWAGRCRVRRFVLASSIKAAAVGQREEVVEAEVDPGTPYGRSKAAAERLVSAWTRADAERAAVILRPAPVYGPGNEANLAAFVRCIRAGRPCLIGRGDVRKSVVSRANLAAAIEFAAQAAAVGCEVYNVSDVTTYSVAELAGIIAEVASAPAPRRMPAVVARAAALLGDAVTGVSGRDFPLTSARLRALMETSVFPCDKLIAAGFRHPESTREGIAAMLAKTG